MTTPETTTRWRDKTVYIYFHPELAGDNQRLLDETLQAVRHSEHIQDMESRLDAVADDHDVRLLSFLDQPDHADPLGMRISVAFAPDLIEDADNAD